jgi:hypothetical protein
MLDLSMFADGAARTRKRITRTGDEARLDVLIPAGEIVFSPRTGFGNPKQVERETCAVDAAALKAGSHHGSTFLRTPELLSRAWRKADRRK